MDDFLKPAREVTEDNFLKPAKEVTPGDGYSEDDLYQFTPQLRDYFSVMVGENSSEWSDDEVVDKFVNRMRGFNAGNSVRAIRELSRLKQLDDDQLSTVGQAYGIFNNMSGLFSEDTTFRERVGGIVDYARSAILDPANVLSFGAGKVATIGGGKIAARAAQQAAMKAAKKGGIEAGEEVFKKTMLEAGAREATELAAKQGATILKGPLQRATTREALKELGITVAVDTAFAVGTELAYQQGMFMTGEQDAIDKSSVGLAALGTMVLGGLTMGAAALRGSSGNRLINLREDPEAAQKAFVSATTDLQTSSFTTWAEKVSKGKELKDLDNKFWRTILVGDEEIGFKGLIVSMYEQGFVFNPRYKDEPISNQIAEILKAGPQEAKDNFLETFVKSTGIKMDEMAGLTMEEFSNAFASKISSAADLLGSVGRISQKLAKKETEVSLEDVVADQLGLLIEAPSTGTSKIVGGIGEKISNVAPEMSRIASRFQNNTIRMIVSNLSTTALNVQGWAWASGVNTLSDTLLASWYGLSGAVKGIARAESAVGDLYKAQSLLSLQKQKIKNLIDPNMTHDAYRALANAMPQQMRELTLVLPGGIEDVNKLLQTSGFDPKLTFAEDNIETFVDAIQRVNLVRLQDSWTKSQEFMYQFDRELRMQLGMTLKEFTSDGIRANKLMRSEEFAKVISKANDETLRAIFSKSFKGKGTLGETAAIIEDFRNIPGLGILVPFGRFFNNTIATAAEMTPAAASMKLFGAAYKDKPMSELIAKSAASWAVVSVLLDDEVESIQKGLGIFQTEDSRSGDVVDQTWEFPFSLYKGIARLTAHRALGVDPTPEELQELQGIASNWKTFKRAFENNEPIPAIGEEASRAIFGQLTRELVSAGDGVYDTFIKLLNGDEGAVASVQELLVATPPQFMSGWTRFLEPVNQVVGLAMSNDFSAMDRRQGNKLWNDSLRYMDFMVEAVTGTERNPQYSAAQGKVPQTDFGKFLGNRGAGFTTNTQRVMNSMGLETYKLSEYMQETPEVNSAFNKLFNSLVEKEATRLWESEKFQRLSPDEKKVLWEDAVGKTRKNVMTMLRTNLQRTGNLAQVELFDLLKDSGRANVQKALQKVLPDVEIEDLTLSQIRMLETYLKNYKTKVRIQK